MTTIDASEPLVVRGPAGVLAAVPAVLGFHPRDSLVQVCLAGPRARVGPMGRVDLDPPFGTTPAEYQQGVTATLLGVARRHAESVLLIWYRSLPGRRPVLISATIHALRAEGIPIRDVISVCGGRFHCEGAADTSTDDDDHSQRAGSQPMPGPDDTDVILMRASAALRGRTILTDRDELRRSIDGPAGPEALRAARSAFSRTAATPPPGVDDYSALCDLALLECSEHGVLTAIRTAQIVRGLDDPELRDRLVARAVADHDEPWTAVLAACARNTPTMHAGDLCALLALVAYCDGDGALAQVAVDRALESTGGHSMARLMAQVMAAGIHPRQVADRFATDPPIG